jgi:flagella basal body P-ring formation protein FlgA
MKFVSKVKTPQQKKRLSYEHDRRNTYGENQKSSRKNIPLSKQRSHQDERRSVRQALIGAQGVTADDVVDEAQSQALRKSRLKRLKGFRKSPDETLGQVIKRRLRRQTGGNG